MFHVPAHKSPSFGQLINLEAVHALADQQFEDACEQAFDEYLDRLAENRQFDRVSTPVDWADDFDY